MPTYLHNTATGLTAYGFGDTRLGVDVIDPIYGGFPEYTIKSNSSFFVEIGTLFIPALSASENGFYITYVQPGWSYRSRVSIRPTFVPFRKDFFSFNPPDPFVPPTLNDAYEKLNTLGDPGHTDIGLNVMRIKSAGFISYSKRTMYESPKDILVSANGQFTVQYYIFPWPLATSPDPANNFSGMQRGCIIKFFSEDQYSIITFDEVQDVRTKLNVLPEF
jgi:hypothetical protein